MHNVWGAHTFDHNYVRVVKLSVEVPFPDFHIPPSTPRRRAGNCGPTCRAA